MALRTWLICGYAPGKGSQADGEKDKGRSLASEFEPVSVNIWVDPVSHVGFPSGQVIKNLPANAGDLRDVGPVPGLRRSPGEGNATHSSILPWEIPWTEEPSGLQFMGSQRVGHD